METNRHSKLIRSAALAALAICFSAGMLSAEVWEAKFSLPSETSWAGVVLPAGSYTLKLDTFNNGTPMQLKQGPKHIAMVMAQSTGTPPTPAKSQLLVVHEGNKATVHILYIAELGTEFHFHVPDAYEVHTRLITRAFEPPVIERIPVIVLGK